MVTANLTGSGVDVVTASGTGYIPFADAHNASLLDYFPIIPVSTRTAVIVNEVSPDGSVNTTSESTEKPLVDSDLDVDKAVAVKYSGIVTCSEEMIDDIPFMENLIRTKLVRELKNDIAGDFLAAILAATPTLAAGGLTAGTGSTGKISDIPPAVVQDMQTDYGYTPTLWLLNAPNYAKLFNEAKVNLLWYAMNEPRIVACDKVNVANICGLDPMMFPIYMYQDITIEVGRTGDDYKYNRVTIRGEARVSWNIAGNCLRALYNDSISSTLAAIA